MKGVLIVRVVCVMYVLCVCVVLFLVYLFCDVSLLFSVLACLCV